MSDETARDAQLVAVLHGTHSPRGRATHESLIGKVRALVPDVAVKLCWLDVLEPSLAQCLAEHTGPAIVVPVLLSIGYHTEVDIPAIVAVASTVAKPVVQARHLGPDPKIVTALLDRLVQTGAGTGPTLLVGAGSSDIRAAGELRLAAQRLSRLTNATVQTAQVGDEPVSPDSDLQIASYLLAPGHFADRLLAANHGRRVSAPLGDHALVAELVVERYRSALALLPS